MPPVPTPIFVKLFPFPLPTPHTRVVHHLSYHHCSSGDCGWHPGICLPRRGGKNPQRVPNFCGTYLLSQDHEILFTKLDFTAHLLKNGRGNIESHKFKVITKFASRKFTLILIWRDLQNFRATVSE